MGGIFLATDAKQNTKALSRINEFSRRGLIPLQNLSPHWLLGWFSRCAIPLLPQQEVNVSKAVHQSKPIFPERKWAIPGSSVYKGLRSSPRQSEKPWRFIGFAVCACFHIGKVTYSSEKIRVLMYWKMSDREKVDHVRAKVIKEMEKLSD